jgi:hypothetical protein
MLHKHDRPLAVPGESDSMAMASEVRFAQAAQVAVAAGALALAAIAAAAT